MVPERSAGGYGVGNREFHFIFSLPLLGKHEPCFQTPTATVLKRFPKTNLTIPRYTDLFFAHLAGSTYCFALLAS